MQELTDIEFQMKSRGDVDSDLRLVPSLFGEQSVVFGASVPQAPCFYVQAKPAEIWARFTDHGFAGMAVRDFEQWRSVYCYSGPIPEAALRKLYEKANIHIYCSTNDNLYANKSWIGLHAASAGTKEIKLPYPADVYNAFEKKRVGKQISQFRFEMKFGETALFILSPTEISDF